MASYSFSAAIMSPDELRKPGIRRRLAGADRRRGDQGNLDGYHNFKLM